MLLRFFQAQAQASYVAGPFFFFSSGGITLVIMVCIVTRQAFLSPFDEPIRFCGKCIAPKRPRTGRGTTRITIDSAH